MESEALVAHVGHVEYVHAADVVNVEELHEVVVQESPEESWVFVGPECVTLEIGLLQSGCDVQSVVEADVTWSLMNGVAVSSNSVAKFSRSLAKKVCAVVEAPAEYPA